MSDRGPRYRHHEPFEMPRYRHDIRRQEPMYRRDEHEEVLDEWPPQGHDEVKNVLLSDSTKFHTT